ncbi:hypothetical protein FOZ61_009005, partial [Perkinsus olseni]
MDQGRPQTGGDTDWGLQAGTASAALHSQVASAEVPWQYCGTKPAHDWNEEPLTSEINECLPSAVPWIRCMRDALKRSAANHSSCDILRLGGPEEKLVGRPYARGLVKAVPTAEAARVSGEVDDSKRREWALCKSRTLSVEASMEQDAIMHSMKAVHPGAMVQSSDPNHCRVTNWGRAERTDAVCSDCRRHSVDWQVCKPKVHANCAKDEPKRLEEPEPGQPLVRRNIAGKQARQCRICVGAADAAE